MSILTAVLFTAGLFEPASAVVGPEGEWVSTGPPAAPSVIVNIGTLVTIPGGTALLTGSSVQRYVPATGGFVPAGSLLGNGGVPTVLPIGKILISGLSPAELYDAAAQVSTLTGAMNFPRRGHQATLLQSGDVLVSGGVDVNGQLVGQAEIYHTAQGNWTLTGTMNNPRTGHTAIRLPSGSVLAAGGSASFVPLTTAEIYNPGSGAWTLTAPNTVGGAVSELLPNGQALVVGNAVVDNVNTTASQNFDPGSGTWSAVVAVPGLGSATPKALVKLNDGRELLVGSSLAGSCFLINAALFDPGPGTWSVAATPLNNVGDFASLAVLPDGRALLAFIQGCSTDLHPAAQLFRPNNTTPRLDVTPTTLDFGNIHVGGRSERPATVQNTGEAHLDGSVILSNAPGFALVSGDTYSLDPNQGSATVLSFTGATFGTFTGSAIFRSNGGWITVPLTGTVGFLLSGRITRTDGTGVPSIPVALQGPVNTVTSTNDNGDYSFSVPPGSYTIAPSDASLVFSPPNRNVVVTNADIGSLNFEVPTALAAAVLPSSRAVQVGTAATAFATIINVSNSEATDCGIAPITSVGAAFTYQTTNPQTNAVTGTPDTPVSIPAHQFQTYVFAFTPRVEIAPTDVQLSFKCTNTNPTPVISGVNTFLLSASTTPGPDMVALAATPKQNGIVNIPTLTGTGVFAVATVNVGAAGTVTVVADTGGVTLPINLFVCETVPATGQCMAPPSTSVTTSVAANATPTFGVFVAGTGVAVPFDPAKNRVFVRLKDQAGVTRGSTSVAVTTDP